jgi:hypothetical protein
VPSLHSFGEIDVRAVLVTVVEANVIIALAAESTAGAEVEALPFNFLTSRCTCICSVRLMASSAIARWRWASVPVVVSARLWGVLGSMGNPLLRPWEVLALLGGHPLLLWASLAVGRIPTMGSQL